LGTEPAEVQGKTLEQSLGILREWGVKTADLARQAGADQLGGAHELWTSSPYTVGDEIRLNPDHPVNRAIADTVGAFAKQQIRFGYWVRPEFVKQPLPNVLSDHFFTPYYGYVQQYFPPASPIVERDGLKLIRQHPNGFAWGAAECILGERRITGRLCP